MDTDPESMGVGGLADQPGPDGKAPDRSPTFIGRLAVALAVSALVAYAVAAVLFTLPVSTPAVQRCGAPGAYLIAGRTDVFPDAEGRILGPDDELVTLDPMVAAAARDQPCRERVAARAAPAAGLVGAATAVGVGAFALELLVVRPRRRRALQHRHLFQPSRVG